MRRFLFLLIFGLAGTGVLVALGVWQVQRLGWKQDTLAQIESRISAAPVSLPGTPDPETDRYLSVSAQGRMTGPSLRVLVSRKRVGAGYRVITGFRTGGRSVLLDRGFIPVESELPAPYEGQVEVTGNLHWPRESDGFTPPPDQERNIWFARDVPAMAKVLGTEPVMIVVRDLSGHDDPVTPLPVDTAGIPNDHLQYAITWFSLAVIWAAMTAYFLWRTRDGAESPKS